MTPVFEDVTLQVFLGRHGGDLPRLVDVELVVVQLTLFVLLEPFLGPPIPLLDVLLDFSERSGLPQFFFPLRTYELGNRNKLPIKNKVSTTNIPNFLFFDECQTQ